MFKITERKGFHMTFENGWTVSVQFGYGNYCANRSIGRYRDEVPDCVNAEIAAWNENHEWYQFESDIVRGYVSADEVAVFIAEIASKPKV